MAIISCHLIHFDWTLLPFFAVVCLLIQHFISHNLYFCCCIETTFLEKVRNNRPSSWLLFTHTLKRFPHNTSDHRILCPEVRGFPTELWLKNYRMPFNHRAWGRIISCNSLTKKSPSVVDIECLHHTLEVPKHMPALILLKSILKFWIGIRCWILTSGQVVE